MTTSMVRSEDVAGIESPSRWERLAIASGIGYVAVFFVGLAFFILFVVPKFAPIDAPPEEHAASYAEMGFLGDLTSYLLTLQAPFLLLFLGGLYAVLRRAEGRSGALAGSAFGAGVTMAMIWPMGVLIAGVGTDIAVAGGDAITAFHFDGMAPLSLALSAFPRTVLLAAASLVVLESGIAPRWIGWTGLALAVVSLIGTGMFAGAYALFPVLMLGMILFVVWVLALCVALLRRVPKAEAAR